MGPSRSRRCMAGHAAAATVAGRRSDQLLHENVVELVVWRQANGGVRKWKKGGGVWWWTENHGKHHAVTTISLLVAARRTLATPSHHPTHQGEQRGGSKATRRRKRGRAPAAPPPTMAPGTPTRRRGFPASRPQTPSQETAPSAPAACLIKVTEHPKGVFFLGGGGRVIEQPSTSSTTEAGHHEPTQAPKNGSTTRAWVDRQLAGKRREEFENLIRNRSRYFRKEPHNVFVRRQAREDLHATARLGRRGRG